MWYIYIIPITPALNSLTYSGVKDIWRDPAIVGDSRRQLLENEFAISPFQVREVNH